MAASTTARPVAIYAQDGGGLGHVRRATNVAAAVTAHAPETRVVIATRSARATAAIDLPAGTDVLKLPDFVELGREPTGRRLLHYDTEPEVFLRLRRALLRTLLAELRPAVLIVDNEPTGAQGELVDALREARAEGWVDRVLFGLRDIAGSNLRDERLSGAPWHEVDELRPERLAALRELYDEILVYGDPELFPSGAYGLEGVDVPQRTVGYLFSGRPARDARGVRAAFSIQPEVPLVAVLAGAGVDGRGLFEPFLRDVAPRLPAGAVAVVVGGPLLPDADWEAIAALGAERPNVRVVRTADAVSLVHAAGAVVCRGGYNTVGEAVHARHRPIIVPRPPVRAGRIDEQQIRADIFARHGLAVPLEPDPVDPDRLAGAIDDALRGPRLEHSPFDAAATGARVAAAVLPRPALAS